MFDYDNMLAEYEKLKAENTELKQEIARLKGGTLPKINTKNSGFVRVNKYSSPQDKINLFRSLFFGRGDVFAKRWFSKVTEKSGYQPVCGNEWNNEFCDKKKYKCSNCPNRKFMPLTDKDIYNHLAGKDIYARDVEGIYPMLKDESCNFCCVDFDDNGYVESVHAFCSVCNDYNIPAYIERSRSGNGAHIWIFFSTPQNAKIARRFASGILTTAMERCSRIDFKSYDRMFPN